MGRLRDPIVGRPGDEMIGHSGDVRGTLLYMFFKFDSETY